MRPVLDTRSIIARQMGKSNRKFCAFWAYFLFPGVQKRLCVQSRFCNIYGEKKRGDYLFSQLQLLQLPEHCFAEQLQPSGQPIHFLPLFLALYTYHAAKPRIATITAIIMISVITITFCH